MSFKAEAELLINKCNQCPVNTCRKKFTIFLIGIEKFLPALKKFAGSALAYWDHGEGQAMWGRATSRIEIFGDLGCNFPNLLIYRKRKRKKGDSS